MLKKIGQIGLIISVAACARTGHIGKEPDFSPPLESPERVAMIAAGVSVAGRVISEHQADLTDLEAEIIEWIEA